MIEPLRHFSPHRLISLGCAKGSKHGGESLAGEIRAGAPLKPAASVWLAPAELVPIRRSSGCICVGRTRDRAARPFGHPGDLRPRGEQARRSVSAWALCEHRGWPWICAALARVVTELRSAKLARCQASKADG